MTSASEIRTSDEQPARPATSRMGPKPALTLERIADAAVAIADAEGIDAISMQRVAAEFGYTKMSLYRYVTSKDELVAAMIDRAVEEPPQHDAVTGWKPQLEAWTRLLAATWQRHPWLPLATMGDREMGPNELGWIDQAIAILAATALTPAEQTATVLLICGHIRNTQSVETAGTQPWTGERQRDLVRSHRDQFQALSHVVDDTTAAADRGRDFGLQVIVAGVEALLAERARPPRKRGARTPT